MSLGIDWNKYAKMPDAMSVDRLGLLMQQTFGKNIPAGMRGPLAALLADPELLGNKGEFIERVSGALGPIFGGKLKPQDAHNLAKAVGSFYQLGTQSVNTEGLLRAIIAGHPTLAQANALFGQKQGARALAAMGDQKLFEEFVKKLRDTPEGFAHQIAVERMAGFSGALQRTEGALMNLFTALGRANDPFLTAGFDRLAKFLQSVAELDQGTLRFVTYLGAATTGLIAFNSALKIGQAVNNIARGGPASTAGPAAAAGMFGWLPWVGAALTMATTPDIMKVAPGGRPWEEVLKERWGGKAAVDVRIEVVASDDFKTRFDAISSRGDLRGFDINLIPGRGTTGSLGKSMQEASPWGGGR